MKDRYGRKFRKKEILNAELIDFVERRSLSDFTDQDLWEKTVLITDPDGRKRLYLFSDLQEQFKANHYCRLEDPITRRDILSQVPEFAPAIQFEQNAAHYNAYVLGLYPEFIPLLVVYAQEMLNLQDEFAFLDTNKDNIYANKSVQLDTLYQTLADMPAEKQEAFYSLFITNRTYYEVVHEVGAFLNLPAKWVPAEDDRREKLNYLSAVSRRLYRPYPHRNVLLADLITNPEDGCLHSWGMDVLYLLLEYHIGMGKPFALFEESTNLKSYRMEQTLRQRIEEKRVPGLLSVQRGQDLFERAKEAALSDFPPQPLTGSIATPESTRMKQKLTQECVRYMDHLLAELNFDKKSNYPQPGSLKSPNKLLVQKYLAVYELYSALHQQSPYVDDDDRLDDFVSLYNDKERQEMIASHRDGLGIRFLNVVLSILSLGSKNLLTRYLTGGYYGFLTARGGIFVENVREILTSSPQ